MKKIKAKLRKGMVTLMWRLLLWPNWAVIRFFLRINVVGAEHLRQRYGGPVILVGNHTSYLDPLVWAALLVTSPLAPIAFMVRRSVWQWGGGLLGFLLPFFGCFCTGSTAGKGRVADLIRAEEMLGEMPLGIFPEGKRQTSGELGKFADGVGYLAAATGVTVIPIGIRGLASCTPLKFFGRRRRVRVVIGEPMIFIASPKTETVAALRQRREIITKTIRQAVEACLTYQE